MDIAEVNGLDGKFTKRNKWGISKTIYSFFFVVVYLFVLIKCLCILTTVDNMRNTHGWNVGSNRYDKVSLNPKGGSHKRNEEILVFKFHCQEALQTKRIFSIL